MALTTLVSIVLGALTLYVAKTLWSKKSLKSLPPGPAPMPVLGNITDLPPAGEKDWVHWIQHKNRYGVCIRSDYTDKLLMSTPQARSAQLL